MKTKFKFKSIRLSLTFLIILICFGCGEDTGISEMSIPIKSKPHVLALAALPPGNPINLNDFRVLVSTRINAAFNATENYDGRYNNYIYYNYERLIFDEVTTLNQNFQIPNLNRSSFSRDVARLITPEARYRGVPIDFVQFDGRVNTYFNSTQRNLLTIYFNNMLLAVDASSVEGYYNVTKNAVGANSSLSLDQKIAVMGIVEIGNEFAKSFFAENWTAIYDDLQLSALSSSGRIAGPCKVNFKNVWLGAVIGGVGGAVKGGIVGATAGTFTVPVLGTATGAVGGAVFGFAVGFLGGASAGVVQELMSNCIFATVAEQPNLNCTSLEYSINNPDQCTIELSNRKAWYALTNPNGN